MDQDGRKNPPSAYAHCPHCGRSLFCVGGVEGMVPRHGPTKGRKCPGSNGFTAEHIADMKAKGQWN
jgi:hypothetical protein